MKCNLYINKRPKQLMMIKTMKKQMKNLKILIQYQMSLKKIKIMIKKYGVYQMKIEELKKNIMEKAEDFSDLQILEKNLKKNFQN